jgi:hypothetical protein
LRRDRALAGAILAVGLAVSCAAASPDNAEVQRDFTEHRSNVEVTASGAVTRLLADAPGADGTHQRFIVQLTGLTQTVLIDNNVDIGRRVPVAEGDSVTIHGEFVWNDQGGLIHFTHHDPSLTHEGGWIDLRGTRYQ